MSDEQASILGEVYAAFSRADLGAVLSRMAPDVHWRLPGSSFAGRGEVEELLTRLKGDGWPAGDMRVARMSACDGHVVVHGTCRGDFVHVWSMRGDVLTALEVR